MKSSAHRMQALAAMIAVLAAQGVLAQQAPATADANASASRDTAPQQVTITGTKRVTKLQETPVSVTAITGDEIAERGIKSAVDLGALVPNLQVGTSTFHDATLISIRGIGSSQSAGEQPVAFHIDGVYMSQPQAPNAVFFDLERIEVLNGPQGTLWGRNTPAGAINVITNKPGRKFDASGQLTLGNYGLVNVQGMINVPLSDAAAFRVAMLSETRKGYRKNLVAGQPDLMDADDLAVRAQLLLRPSSNLSVLLSADAYRRRATGPGYYWLGFQVPENPFEARTLMDDQHDHVDQQRVSVEVNYKLASATLTSLTAWRRNKYDTISDASTPPSNGVTTTVGSFVDYWDRDHFFNDTSSVSQELRLASDGKGPLQWLGGLYFEEAKSDGGGIFEFGSKGNPPVIDGAVVFQNPSNAVRSQAAFGNLRYALTADIGLEAGLRYSDDHKKNSNALQGVVPGPDYVLTDRASRRRSGEASWSRTTWKLGADWKLTPTNFVYASAGTGFKSGAISFVTLGGVRTQKNADPEDVTSFEIGSKNVFADGRVKLNVTAFNATYNNLIVDSVISDPVNNNFAFASVNSGSARLRGLEADFMVKVTDAFRIDGGLGLLSAKYLTYRMATESRFDGVPTAAQCARCYVDATTGKLLFNADGNSLPRAPRYNIHVTPSFNVAAAGGVVKASVTLTRQGKVYFSALNDGLDAVPTFGRQYAADKQDAYNTVDASLRYDGEFGKRSWFVELWGKNLTNKVYINGVQESLPNIFSSYGTPRTLGVRMGMGL